ncbi:MAG TPA: hypothetical protein PLF32_08370 [Bacteroidales bacterium]|jgi:hypothetical protein|nr:hypothetical protein [Bacteroidales bacterium]HOR82656.1 hypothetical protein [Bacteroidales bacterium]HPJ91847.1 hypothetical protein [Bacteroidales bacterium]
MEISSYQLRINVEEKYYEEVSSIIGLKPKSYKYGWSYEIILEEEKENYNVISKFLDILDGKYKELNKFNIRNSDITVWLIYGYNNQCNIEFDPKVLKRLGENEITLCISCYEVGNG